MSELYFMMTITSRDMLPKFLEAFDKNNLPIGFVSLGYGTAKDDILDMLGLVRSEKCPCATCSVQCICSDVSNCFLTHRL